MIRTLVALFVLCSATAWAQEAGATAAEKAVSRYPDLKKLASGALDAERDAWLKEQGLKLGPDNRDGLWILWAQASISAPTTSDAWGKARLAAFAEARLKAETNFIRETGVKIEVETLRDYFADDSLRDPRNLEVKGHEERLRDKVAQVGEAMLDKALAELEAKPAAGASLEDKRTLLKKTLRRVSFKQASGRVSGMRIMTTLEGTSANGGTNVGAFTPAVFHKASPQQLQRWYCVATHAAVEFSASGPVRSRITHVYDRAQFLVDGALPKPSLP